MQVWPSAPTDYDSFVLPTAVGPVPTSEGGPGTFIQHWNPPFKQGVRITVNHDGFVHGARWWRIGGQVEGGARPFSIHIAPTPAETWMHEPALGSGAGNSTPPTTSGWETIMFDAPVAVTAGTSYLIWAGVPSGNGLDTAREASHFPVPTDSRDRLFTSHAPSSRFNLPATEAQNLTPSGQANAWYWLDPLVTAGDAPPTTPPTQVGTSVDFHGPTTVRIDVSRPTGLVATDVTLIVTVSQGTADANVTCPGFTEVFQETIESDRSLTVLVGTGHTADGSFSLSMTTPLGQYSSGSVSSWRGASTAVTVGGPFSGRPGYEVDITVPATACPDNAIAFVVGHCEFADLAGSTPALVDVRTRDDLDVWVFRRTTPPTDGTTGITTVDPTGANSLTALRHLILPPA